MKVLTAELVALRGDNARRKKANTLGYEDVLKDLGKKFAVTDEPWLEPAVFSLPLTLNADPNVGARFVDDDSYDQGTLAALYECVPNKYHQDMVNVPDFGKNVSHFVSSSHVCTHAECSLVL